MSDTDATPSIEDIVREVMLKLASVVPSNNAPPPVIGNNTTVPNTLMEAIPEFGGNELGEDSNVWCSLVEEITKNVTSQQRLSSATHALTGPAKRWYREWKGKPRTWDTFREDLCSVFVSEKRLHQRMLRAVTYTSDGAVSYAEYVRTKLMYFEQTRVNFKPDELIELVIGAITDESVRQAMMNGNHQTTASMIVGITQFGKTGCEKKTDKGVGERATKGSHTSRKRCFVCDSDDHVQRHCPKKAKSKPSGDDGPVRKIVTCSFCKKRGHEETRCWVKQRTANTSQEQKNAQANVCQTTNMKLTPILLRNTLLNCLMDSGANCSLMRESVAKRTGCNVTPFVTVVRGLGNKSVSTIAKTTAVVQCEDVSLELDIFILPDADVPYEVVIGRNVLRHPDLKMVTDVDGTKLQRTSTFTESGKYPAGEQCCTIDDIGNDMDGSLRELLGRYQHMIARGNHIRSVTTAQWSGLT
ncbi:uncharacterized protein LOC123989273 [Osmia bicornis bicornis]|uniref:uncharacterized protein LOC123989273 n=1 Tax=Osmia bicornis bicornis TaxID=1437191 RepID=UPI001EAEF136|nr:uncharacterized protein LOC123989273 [Osmia bicornis bicornis]